MKTWLLTVSFILVVLLAGCGGGTDEAAPGTGSAAGAAPEAGPVELKIWETYNDEEHDLFMTLVEQYMQQHPGVTISVQQIPYGGHRNKIMTALATRTTPDIARIDNAWIPKLAPRNAIAPLDEFGAAAWGGQLVQAAFQTCLYDGTVFGIPDQVTCLALFYNKDLFAAAGLDPEAPPKTWKDFYNAGRQLTDKANGIFGFAMGNTLWETLPFFFTFGAKVMSDDNHRCLLDSEMGILALKFKTDLYRRHEIEAGAWTPGAISPETGFKARKYAMILSGPWNIQSFKSSGLNFGIGLIPEGPVGTASNVGGTNMVVFRNCAHKQAAFEFLQYLSGPGAQRIWASTLSQIPIHQSVRTAMEETADPYLRVFLRQITTARPIVGNPIMDEVENILNPEMAAALKGDKTPEQALTDGVVAVNKKLQEAFELMQ
ncbi:extracellular solute-binding protein [bacterium]|nr:extracellular solute-binding protein [candidate division CSSED10-310 bacterium]